MSEKTTPLTSPATEPAINIHEARSHVTDVAMARFGLGSLKRAVRRLGRNKDIVDQTTSENELGNPGSELPEQSEAPTPPTESKVDVIEDPNYKLVSAMLSPEAIDEETRVTAGLIENNPVYKELDELDGRHYDLTKNLYKIPASDREKTEENERELKETSDRIDELENNGGSKFRTIREKLRNLVEYRNLQINKADPRADSILQIIESTPPIHPASENEPPFKKHKDNTESAWGIVSPESITEYLEDKVFFDTEADWFRAILNDGDQAKLEIAGGEEGIKVPTNNIVSVAGFDSWLGRGFKGRDGHEWVSNYGSRIGRSIDSIRHYAALPSEIPKITRIRMFIQPDGKVFFDNGGGDSHRIAAAILRGEDIVTAKTLQVIPLDKNYLK